jgi:hypothetical protein
MRAQGATEYLVLLAVVLIVALVSIALLGFFPGISSDARLAQNDAYWRSAAPFSVLESKAYVVRDNNQPGTYALFYVRIRNTGTDFITLSAALGDGDTSTVRYYEGTSTPRQFTNITLGPGEEMCIGHPWIGCGNVTLSAVKPSSRSYWGYPSIYMIGANTICSPDGKGFLQIDSFGFNYTEQVQGASISKKFAGSKPLIIKCVGICDSSTSTCN